MVYRLTGGRIGGKWGKAGVLLLTTRGRTTDQERTTPLLYLEDGRSFVVVATNDGSPRHPAWYLNLEAQPRTHIQVLDKRFEVTSRTAGSEERTSLWPRLVAIYANYERDQKRAARELPVVILERSAQ
jgi:deazaflavin-dependent oxidoreductase (nitroreductase family)